MRIAAAQPGTDQGLLEESAELSGTAEADEPAEGPSLSLAAPSHGRCSPRRLNTAGRALSRTSGYRQLSDVETTCKGLLRLIAMRDSPRALFRFLSCMTWILAIDLYFQKLLSWQIE